MRTIVASVISALLVPLSVAFAKPPAPSIPVSAASVSASSMTPRETQLVEHGHYVNRSARVRHQTL